MYASNMTFEEVLQYADIPEHMRQAIDAMLDRVADLEQELEAERKAYERVAEQCSFARDLVEQIDDCVKRDLPDRKTGAIVEFRKAYQRIREDTYFEV